MHAAGGIHVVASRVVRVDGAVDSVTVCAGQGVPVEALLGGDAIRVIEIARVAQKKLEMSLGAEGGRKEGRRRDR